MSKDRTIMTRITTEDGERLDRVAQLRNTSVAAIAREAIQLYLYGRDHFGEAWPLVEGALAIVANSPEEG